MAEKSALVLFSGGQDSTVCLAYALDKFDRVETIGFTYGQRHHVEMECRLQIREKMGSVHSSRQARLGQDHIADLSGLGAISETSLTRDMDIQVSQTGLPNTFVPGRNLMFLTMAGALAWRRGIGTLVGGMCETDYSGYPDCRRSTMDAQQLALARGMDRPFVIDTPLMWLDKAETWQMAFDLGGSKFVDLVIEDTHTCYKGERSRRHDWGYGCGTCPACELRAKGWAEWTNQRIAV